MSASHFDVLKLEAEDVQRLDNVLSDGPTPSVTRKALLRRAAAGAAGAATIGAFGPVSSALGANASSANAISDIINAAVTAEALAVTYLTGLIENAKATGVTAFVDVLKAANASELDHYKALRSLGAKPLTTKFWAPDAFFAPGAPFKVLELAEEQFVNAYLIHITATAKAGMDTAARYGAEILGVEAQHLALARFAQKKLPNNVGFQVYKTHTIGGIVDNLAHAGIGFGKRGKGPGKFYEFKNPPHRALAKLASNKPA
jgi:hypothetical protein